ncbi:MAG: glycosyltransferase family 87 protein [Chlamydiota bacterium]
MPSSVTGRASPKPGLKPLILLALTAMLGMHIWVFFTLRQEIRQGYPDFIAFYSVGKCVQRGLGPQLYDLATQARVQQEFAPTLEKRNQLFPWVHPPFEALIFAALAGLSYPAAYWTWNTISAIALVVFILVLNPFLPRLRSVSPALPYLCAFAFFPILDCLLQGQDSILLLLLFGLTFASLKRERDYAAGAWLGLGLFRFQLVLPLLVVIAYQRKWKTLASCAAVGGGLAAVSAVVVGWRGLLNYPAAVLACNRILQGSGVAWNKAMPNWRGIVDHLLGAGTVAGRAVILAGSIAFLGLALWRSQGEPRRPGFDLSFSLAVVVAVLTSYYLFAHDLVMLLLPLLLTAEALLTETMTRPARIFLTAAVGLLFFSPLYFVLWVRYHRFSFLFWVVALLAAGLSMALGGKGEARLTQSAAESES